MPKKKSPIFTYRDEKGDPILQVTHLPDGSSIYTLYNFASLSYSQFDKLFYVGNGLGVPKPIHKSDPEHCHLHDHIVDPPAFTATKITHNHFHLPFKIGEREFKAIFNSLKYIKNVPADKQHLFAKYFSETALQEQSSRFSQFLKQGSSNMPLPLSWYANPECPGWEKVPGLASGSDYSSASHWLSQNAAINPVSSNLELARYLKNNRVDYTAMSVSVFLGVVALLLIVKLAINRISKGIDGKAAETKQLPKPPQAKQPGHTRR